MIGHAKGRGPVGPRPSSIPELRRTPLLSSPVNNPQEADARGPVPDGREAPVLLLSPSILASGRSLTEVGTPSLGGLWFPRQVGQHRVADLARCRGAA